VCDSDVLDKLQFLTLFFKRADLHPTYTNICLTQQATRRRQARIHYVTESRAKDPPFFTLEKTKHLEIPKKFKQQLLDYEYSRLADGKQGGMEIRHVAICETNDVSILSVGNQHRSFSNSQKGQRHTITRMRKNDVLVVETGPRQRCPVEQHFWTRALKKRRRGFLCTGRQFFVNTDTAYEIGKMYSVFCKFECKKVLGSV
jgi:hypothetical protein